MVAALFDAVDVRRVAVFLAVVFFAADAVAVVFLAGAFLRVPFAFELRRLLGPAARFSANSANA